MNLIYEPFIGPAYNGQPSRLWVLGNSHHGTGPEATGKLLTRNTVCAWSRDDRSRHYSFFTKLAAALNGVATWELDRETAFSKFAFSNFFQSPMAGPRTRPSNALIEPARRALAMYVQEHKPTYLVALGRQVWEALPEFCSDHRIVLGSEEAGGWISTGGRTIAAMYMQHPSSRFSPTRWHGVLKRFLQSSRPPHTA